MVEVRNGVIRSVQLGRVHRDLLSAWILIDYGDETQSFGGYHLKGSYMAAFVDNVLRVAGVESWEELPGRPVRVRAEHVKVHALGHYLKDEWFDPAIDLEKEGDHG